MHHSEAMNRTTVLVCITCRYPNEPPPGAQAGVALAQAAAQAAAAHPQITVQQVRCLANCSRGLSAAVRRDGGWSYVFGGLNATQDGPALVAGARLMATATDGLMPWRERPESLKRGLIARLPPSDFDGQQ